MKIINIHNKKRIIYLFQREENKKQIIVKDSSFHPYFYEPDENGQYKSYLNVPLKKIICTEPSEVAQMKSDKSHEADILYPKRYILDRIDSFEKCPIKYAFIDIEVLAKELPDYKDPKYNITCISVYNNFDGDILPFYIEDFEGNNLEEKEIDMLESFVDYLEYERPDLWLSWYTAFDYPYIHNRYNRLTKKNFAKQISPIKQVRRGYENDIFYPAGMSILDYLAMFKKIKSREKVYTLDHIAQKHLKEKAWGKSDFGTLNKKVLEKNINDVLRLKKLEEKFKIIDYYDELRIFSKCLWEDVIMNSKIIDAIVLREAKNRNIILPNKPFIEEREELQGAYRRADTGVFFDIYKADVGSMYPNQLINFCLDPINLRKQKESNTVEINGLHFKQNPDTLLPIIAQDLINEKDKLKT